MRERPGPNPEDSELDPEKFSVSSKRALEEDAKQKQHLAEGRQKGLIESADETLEQIEEKADAEMRSPASPEAARRKEAKILMNEALRRKTGEAILTQAFNQTKTADALASLAAKRSHQRSAKGEEAIDTTATRQHELPEKFSETAAKVETTIPKLTLSYQSYELAWHMQPGNKLKLLDKRTRQIDQEYMENTNGIVSLVRDLQHDRSVTELPLIVQEAIEEAISALRTIEAFHQAAKEHVDRELQERHGMIARRFIEKDIELMRGHVPTLRRMYERLRELSKKPPK